jgi:hypothetical protein
MTINIAESARQGFTLAVDLATARAYFRDFQQTLRCLPDLTLVRTYARSQYRIVYSAVHSGVYRVELYSDIEARFDEAEDVLCVTPLKGMPAVVSSATLGSLTGQGDYSSRLILRSAGAYTKAKYEVRIEAALAKPVGLKLIPDTAVRLFIERVVQRRIREITAVFVQRSIAALHAPHRDPA